MHYYKHHIGDFNHATRHLTRIERSIYRDLLDLYYDKEEMLPLDLKKISKLILVSKKEFQELQNVLDEFFVKTENGFKNTRCEIEIEEYHKAAENSRKNGKNGGRPKKESTTKKETKAVSNTNPEETERVFLENPELTQKKANQEPVTINHKPETSNHGFPQTPRNDFEFFSEIWAKHCPDFEMGPMVYVERSGMSLRLKYTDEQLENAIKNYAEVLESEQHFYKQRHPLSDFLKFKIFKFFDGMKPLENFLIAEKSAAKNSEANEVWENVLNLAGRACSQKTYESLPKRIKVALKSIGGLSALGLTPKSNLISVKSIFLEAYTQAGES